MADIVRVLRVIEYVGPRKRVEETVAKSIHGERPFGQGLVIRAATIGAYPEILGASPDVFVVPVPEVKNG